ncbi:hypothetical protein PVAP13_5NG529386 [Panicum virgatum]|uniref:Uncharacterized protein n=1 Tax=Panicum virgatum TaxID=38727 RepID=A0A8T0S529_PANVG|nr:hypothetical protein PVAP13_5NG529386 [Panicum virgatum]
MRGPGLRGGPDSSEVRSPSCLRLSACLSQDTWRLRTFPSRGTVPDCCRENRTSDRRVAPLTTPTCHRSPCRRPAPHAAVEAAPPRWGPNTDPPRSRRPPLLPRTTPVHTTSSGMCPCAAASTPIGSSAAAEAGAQPPTARAAFLATSRAFPSAAARSVSWGDRLLPARAWRLFLSGCSVGIVSERKGERGGGGGPESEIRPPPVPERCLTRPRTRLVPAKRTEEWH